MDRKQFIIKLREKGYSFQKIGTLLSLSRQRIHQILNPIKYKPTKSTQLPDYILPENFCKLCKQNYCKKHSYLSKITGRDLTREKIRIRDNHTCQICDKKWKKGQRKLDVHHKDNDKEKTKQYDVFEKEKNNMITLCHKCHMNLPNHGGKR